MKIIRKDNIEYERKEKQINYDTKLNMRISSKTIDELKEISKEQQMKYQAVIRMIIEDFIEKHRIDNVIKNIEE